MFIFCDYYFVYIKLLGVDYLLFQVNGNYFDEELIEDDVVYSIFFIEVQKELLFKIIICRWMLGEIIIIFVEECFKIEKLVEEYGFY